jgi:hypothetical protein
MEGDCGVHADGPQDCHHGAVEVQSRDDDAHHVEYEDDAALISPARFS